MELPGCRSALSVFILGSFVCLPGNSWRGRRRCVKQAHRSGMFSRTCVGQCGKEPKDEGNIEPQPDDMGHINTVGPTGYRMSLRLALKALRHICRWCVLLGHRLSCRLHVVLFSIKWRRPCPHRPSGPVMAVFAWLIE